MARLSEALIQDKSELNFVEAVTSNVFDNSSSSTPVLAPQQVNDTSVRLNTLTEKLKTDLLDIKSSNLSEAEKNSQIFSILDDFKKVASRTISKPIQDSFKVQVKNLTQDLVSDAVNLSYVDPNSSTYSAVKLDTSDSETSSDTVVKLNSNNSGTLVDSSSKLNSINSEISSDTSSVTTSEFQLDYVDIPDFETSDSANLSPIDNVISNFKDKVNESQDKISGRVDRIQNIISEKYNTEQLGADAIKLVIPVLSGIVNSTADTVTRFLNSEIVNYAIDPMSIASDLFSGTITEISKSFSQITDAVYIETVGKLDKQISDKIQTIDDKLRSAVSNFTHGAVDNILRRKLNFVSSDEEVNSAIRSEVTEPSNDRVEPKIRTVEPQISDNVNPNYSSETTENVDTKVALDFNPSDEELKKTQVNIPLKFKSVTSKVLSRKDIKVFDESLTPTSDYNYLMLSNDMYWTVDILPHSPNMVSLRDAFDVQSDGQLPIVSFGLTGDEVKMVSFGVEGNVNYSIILPSGISKPSRLTITLPELVKKSGNVTVSCLHYFRTQYLETFFKSNSVSDFRKCAYEITVSKYTPLWDEAKTWKLLGIPEINTGEQGSSSSGSEFSELSFVIVGDDSEVTKHP